MSNLQITSVVNLCPNPSWAFMQAKGSSIQELQCPTLAELELKWGLSDLKPNPKTTQSFSFFNFFDIFSWFSKVTSCSKEGMLEDQHMPFRPGYILNANEHFRNHEIKYYYHGLPLDQRAACFPNAHALSLAEEGKAAQLVDFVVREEYSLFDPPQLVKDGFFDELTKSLERLFGAFESDVYDQSEKLKKIAPKIHQKILLLSLFPQLVEGTQAKKVLQAFQDLGYDLDLSNLLKEIPELSPLRPLLQTYRPAFIFQRIYTTLEYLIASGGFQNTKLPYQSLCNAILELNPHFSEEMPFTVALMQGNEEKALELIAIGNYDSQKFNKELSQAQNQLLEFTDTMINEFDFVKVFNFYDYTFSPDYGFSGVSVDSIDTMKAYLQKSYNFLTEQEINTFVDDCHELLKSATKPLFSTSVPVLKNFLTSPILQALAFGASDSVLKALLEKHSFNQTEANLFIYLIFLLGKTDLFETLLLKRPELIDNGDQKPFEGTCEYTKLAQKGAKSLRKFLRLISERKSYSTDSRNKELFNYITPFQLALFRAMLSYAPITTSTYLDIFGSIIDFVPESSTKMEMIAIENLLTNYYENGHPFENKKLAIVGSSKENL